MAETFVSWEAVSALGSAASGLGTILAAALAGRIAWLAQYGPKPMIGGVSFGVASFDPEKRVKERTFGLELINRRKHPVTVIRATVDGLNDLLDMEASSSSVPILSSESQVGRVVLWLGQRVEPGETLDLKFAFVLDRAGPNDQKLKFGVRVYEDMPFVRRFRVSRAQDFGAIWRGLKR